MDVFRVLPVGDASFTPDDQVRFTDELRSVIALLDTGQFEEARFAVNRRLVEQLGKRRGSFSGLLHPVQITFDNSQSPTDTSWTSGRTIRRLFCTPSPTRSRCATCTSRKPDSTLEDGKIHDRFYVRNRHGQKLTDATDQQQLRLTAVLIKQFTHALTWAPDPTKALEAFDQFLDLTVQQTKGKAQQEAFAFLSDKKTFPLLARLLGASDFLWEDFLRRQHDHLLPLLQDYRDAPLITPRATLRKELDRVVDRAKTDDGRKAALNSFKDQELFRIDMKHIVEPDTASPIFPLALTQLAEVIVERSLKDCQAKLNKMYGAPRLANRKPAPLPSWARANSAARSWAMRLISKSCSSMAAQAAPTAKPDREQRILRAARAGTLQWIEAKQEGIFHLDVRLRPHGGKGSLANPFDEITIYYSEQGLAAPFERQAMIKLRHVAGDPALGKQVEAHRDRYVYSATPWDVASPSTCAGNSSSNSSSAAR